MNIDELQQENAELKSQLDKLRTNSAALLDERKREKAAHDATKGEMSAVVAERDKLRGELRAFRLDAPVERLIDEIATDAVLFRAVWDRAGYAFALDDAGNPCVTDTEGKPVSVGEGSEARPLAFDAKEIAEFLAPSKDPASWTPDQRRFASVIVGSKAVGSGAAGRPNADKPFTPAVEERTRERPKFGLQ
ncbi:hypothetical protein LDO26_05845 [Luteimonas sp. BDR2-5]|uniref:hypothetical protein n=1 Tax=Proluteimonas luteida TaxID=2878685 RepID=UPI001E3B4B36|nr:hypothetical protein [Luteimonas sp. BDR2-5]MCD9027727.1 hypothetical protein [Luteimonas sp. BDR2-5]